MGKPNCPLAPNLDASRRVSSFGSSTLGLWVHAFGDIARQGFYFNPDLLSDGGLGLSVRGRLYDREIMVRVDSPFYVSRPTLSVGRGRALTDRVAPRWSITFSDWW